MKRNFIIITMIALIASSCSTSIQMTGRYVDDLYYWPGDTPLEAAGADLPVLGSKDNDSKEMLIISEVGEDAKGNKTLDNYIYAEDEPDWYSNVQAQNIDNIINSGEDTLIIPSKEEETYIVSNNYLDGNDNFSYSDRIRRFQDPYYYDPYWGNSLSFGWGNPYYSWNHSYYGWNSWGYNSWGWDPWYNSWGYSPYCCNSWGWGYNSWYSPYYYGYNNNRFDRDDRYESNRRSRNPNAIYGGGGASAISGGRSNNESGITATTNKSVSSNSRRGGVNAGDLSTDSRKTASTGQEMQKRSGAVLTEKRRSSVNSTNIPANTERNGVSPNRSTTRSLTSSPSQNSERRVSGNGTIQNSSSSRSTNYTPSYNKPRTNTRATYNTNRTSEPTRYSSPTENRSTITRTRPAESNTKSNYQIPSTSSKSSSSSYRSNSRSSSSSTPARSYSSGSSSPSRSSSSSSSSPSRSSSSGSSSSHSYSGGSSSSGSSSSGSSSGGSRSSGGSSSSGSRR